MEPGPEHDQGREPRIDRRLREFASLLDGGAAPDVEAFCADAPEDIRGDLRARLFDILLLKRILPGTRVEPSPPGLGEALGDFRILREVGRGSMGVVYLARQVSLDRLVALKVLSPALTGSPRDVERFRREARSAAKLRHPSIVSVIAIGEHRGLAYIAMEFVEGRSLVDALDHVRGERRAGNTGGPPDLFGTRAGKSYVAQAAEVAAGIAEALEHAHANGIIHRDVKPHNVLLDAEGRPRLADFGLARDLSEPSLSRTGDIAGTPYYMSPEQALAKGRGIDHRTDVYSLGVVLYEMLTLERPFQGRTSQQVLQRIAHDEARPVRKIDRSVPRDLEVICAKAMEKRPERRYATAGAMAADLRRFLGHEAILAQPPSLPAKAWRRVERHPALATSSAAGVVALSIGGFAATWIQGRAALAAQLEPLRALSAAEDLAARPHSELVAALRDIARIDERGDDVASADRATLTALRERIHGLGREKRARSDEIAARARGAGDGASRPAAASWWLPQRWSLAREAAELLEDHPEVERLASAQAALPTLAVDSTPRGARVSLRATDPATGKLSAPRSIGATPLAATPVDPGYYRVTVALDGIGSAELIRYLDLPEHTYPIAVELRSNDEVTRDMVRIDPGPFFYGDRTAAFAGGYREERIDAPYWIDRREVTNAEYRAFVEATHRGPPLLWRGGYRPEWDELPVVGVDWNDAVAFAEWRGKRLPTTFEWERAARSTDGRLYPWGDDAARVPECARLDRTRAIAPDLERQIQIYLGGARPVGSLDCGASVEGVYDLLDNVNEWTESLAFDGQRADAALLPGTPVIQGGSFGHWAEWTLAYRSCAVASARDISRGFRCAKSVEP